MSESDDILLIGVDGGGSGCRAAIGTYSKGALAKAEGGPANAASDMDLAIVNIRKTVEAAADKINVTPSALAKSCAHLGLAGILTQQDGARIAQALPFARSTVTDDRPTAISGALGASDGYLLAIGTGTIAGARKGDDFQYVSGWGFQLSDQASGAWLGHAALRYVLLCHDGLAEHTALSASIFEKFGSDPNAIVKFGTTAPPAGFAELAPDIISGAKQGDSWGRSVMNEGAGYLVQFLKKLGFRAGDPLCLTGGVGPHYADYLPADFLSGRAEARGNALDGAFEMARAASLSEPAEVLR